jgi:hypothetical protein
MRSSSGAESNTRGEHDMNSASATLQAGTGRRCINPPPNIAHGGWGAQKHEQAEGIDLDLWATALALSDGATVALIIDVDIQILTNERADQIRAAVSAATGVPLEHIRAAATHTHSGPVPYKSWIEKGYDLVGPWFDGVARWCAEAAAEAIAGLTPVDVRVGRGDCRINANRRCVTPSGEPFLGVNASGVCDHEVIVVRFDRRDGDTPSTVSRSPVATVVHYACHATIMGPANRLITPDYPGAMKRVVEQAVGGRCLFLQGAAGNVGPVQGFQANPQVYRDLGAVLGHEVARVALSLITVPSQLEFRAVIPSGAPLGTYTPQFGTAASLPLRIRQFDIAVPLRGKLPNKPEATAELERWKANLATARATNDAGAATEATYMARRADIQLRMADDFGGKTTASIRGHIIAFGDVALIGCNVEPFCEIGLGLKERSPFPFTTLSGYTNGRMAYLPTGDEWTKGGYEVDNSPFGQKAAEVFEHEVLATLRSLR